MTDFSVRAVVAEVPRPLPLNVTLTFDSIMCVSGKPQTLTVRLSGYEAQRLREELDRLLPAR